MPNYQQTLQPLIDANILSAAEVYFYENDPLRALFQQFFDFCNDNLDLHQDEYDINPSHFYYANDYEINAAAFPRGEHSFIAVNMGAIDRLHTFFDARSIVFDLPQFEHYKAIAAHKHITASHFLFQYNTLYIYYHELGHLIQHNNDAAPFIARENLAAIANADDALKQHVFEFDADWFGAGQLAFHLVEFYKDEHGIINASVEELSDLISLGLSAVFNYYVLTANAFPDIYYQERSHPHAFVRISYVLKFIMDTFAPNLPEGFELDLSAILSNAVILSEEILMDGYLNPAMNFMGVFLQEADNIEEYINKIIEASDNYLELSRNKV